MTDISMGLREAVDDLSWQSPSGKNSPIAGSPSPILGQKARLRAVPADWLARLAEYLRAQHPLKTADHVAERCRGKITAEQVRKWLTLRAAPNGAAMMWMVTAYGPALLIYLFGPSPVGGDRWDWLDVAMQAERVEELGARLVALRGELDAELARGRP